MFAGTGGWDGTDLETEFGRDGGLPRARHLADLELRGLCREAPRERAEQRAACTPDVFRLCSLAIPNVNRIVACLKQQKPNLSKPCQAVMNSPVARTNH